jgi:hypothetical protein
VLHRKTRSPPCLKPTLNIGRPREAQLPHRRRRQTGLIALIAHQDDMVIELRRTGVAVLTRWIQPPFEDVPWDYQRSRDDPIPRNLRIGANVDQNRPTAHRLQRLSRREPAQAATRSCQKLIDRGSCPDAGLIHDPHGRRHPRSKRDHLIPKIGDVTAQ